MFFATAGESNLALFEMTCVRDRRSWEDMFGSGVVDGKLDLRDAASTNIA